MSVGRGRCDGDGSGGVRQTARQSPADLLPSRCVRVPPIPELASPVALAAVAVLALNDHVLKRAFPGPLTGKISDLAGCFVLPLVLSALLALATRWRAAVRLALGAAATAVFFASIKLSTAASSAVARALAVAVEPVGLRGGPIAADPTDLVALPLALVAWAYGARAHARSEAER